MAAVLPAAILPVAGCGENDAGVAVVTLYCSVDEAFSRRVVAVFEKETAIRVQLVADSEAGKTTSLVQRLRLERSRPRADVFWSSEQMQTEQLAREGVLAAYDSPSAGDIPATWRHPEHLWTGLALRARVLAYDPARTRPEDIPRTWRSLSNARYAGRLAMANPLFGTTRSHVAAMAALWGDAELRAFVTDLTAHKTLITDGNSAAVRRLIAGEVDLAMTDSDDVLVARARGHSVAMAFLDMGDGGTMLIPNTVALVCGAPHAEPGRRLIDFLLSARVERMLARSESGNYPVRPSLRQALGVTLPPMSRLPVSRIVEAAPVAIEICRDILLQ